MKREAVTHSKMKRLCRRLDLPTWQAVGLLESVWQLTARETPRGDIGKLSDEDIALAIDYRGDATAMILALVETTWIDRHPQYRYVVHGWSEHADDAVNLKLARGRHHFADGRAPKLTRLGGEERKTLEAYYAQCAQIGMPCAPSSDPCARIDEAHAVRTPSALPEPRQSPAITITPPEPRPAPPAAGAAARDGFSIVPHNGTSNEKKPSTDRPDDEENPESSPWEKICSRYRTAKGTGMDASDSRWLREQMELRSVTPETLLKLMDENPLAGFDTPIAGLKWLLKQAKAKMTSATAPVQTDEDKRCPDCKCEKGKGLTLLPDGKTWIRCHCADLEWIAHQRARGVAIAEPAA